MILYLRVSFHFDMDDKECNFSYQKASFAKPETAALR